MREKSFLDMVKIFIDTAGPIVEAIKQAIDKIKK